MKRSKTTKKKNILRKQDTYRRMERIVTTFPMVPPRVKTIWISQHIMTPTVRTTSAGEPSSKGLH